MSANTIRTSTTQTPASSNVRATNGTGGSTRSNTNTLMIWGGPPSMEFWSDVLDTIFERKKTNTMRSLTTVLDGVIALLTPVTPPDGSNANLTTALAQVTVLRRQSMYMAPEASGQYWDALSATLYRYLPPPTVSPFSDISALVTGTTAAVDSAKREKK